jgi:hypothetical protein
MYIALKKQWPLQVTCKFNHTSTPGSSKQVIQTILTTLQVTKSDSYNLTKHILYLSIFVLAKTKF